ncbi:unnamed protein product [Caenorhabditis auriculariae]|uniref:Macro domain-containing protein n=1 Tax=Caenorhabditis auriculariae TaxID=2777116 RepID=A0A8S1HXM7_9PELO|nr:unnamed protein product [Caenorhabditis auriculariae]
MLHFVCADMFSLSADAIVNAANRNLAPGGGVDGVMSQHCGPRLQEAKNKIVACLADRKLGKSQAVLTEAFDHNLAKYCLNNCDHQSTLDCTSSQSANKARMIVEKDASNVEDSMSAEVKVKYFVERWASTAERIAAARNTTSNGSKETSPANELSPSSFSRASTGHFGKQKSAQIKEPIETPKSRKTITPEERQSFPQYFPTMNTEETTPRRKRTRTARDLAREQDLTERQERVESLLSDDNVRRGMLKSVLLKEKEKKANTLIVMGNVEYMLAAIREPYLSAITTLLGPERQGN